MTAPTSTTVPVPDRMWFVNTCMRTFRSPDRDPTNTSEFAHWLAAGRMFLLPRTAVEFDNSLVTMPPGDPVFAYEDQVGVIAVGRVYGPKDLTVGCGPTDLFPEGWAKVKSVAVDCDTSITCTVEQVSTRTKIGGRPLQTCDDGHSFYLIAVEMLQELHDRKHANPDAEDAATLAAFCIGQLSALLEQSRHNLEFLKDAYLDALVSLVEKGLLAPDAPFSGAHLEEKLLALTLAQPLNELHARKFGAVIRRVAASDVPRTISLFEKLLKAPPIDKFERSQKADLSRHLWSACRAVFETGDLAQLRRMLQLGKRARAHLGRSAFIAALDLRFEALQQDLDHMHQDPDLAPELVRLITNFMHHHDRPRGSEAWEGLLGG